MFYKIHDQLINLLKCNMIYKYDDDDAYYIMFKFGFSDDTILDFPFCTANARNMIFEDIQTKLEYISDIEE